MEHNNGNISKQEQCKRMALGIGAGLPLGAAMGNVGLGLVLGIVLGTAAALWRRKR